VDDESRNNWLLGLLAMGEGWHNNHHRYSVCARQGFRWWEIDLSYMALRFLQLFHIVWDIREPPRSILAERRA
jgi:stearoyl-CoA desaturase (delta-9 desaturase)